MDNEPPPWGLRNPFDAEVFVDDAVRKAVADAADRTRERSRQDQVAQSAPPRPFFSYASDDWAETDIEPRPWLAQGYLMRRTLSLLVGPGASGKSSILVAWTIALALGRPFHRMKPVGACRVMVLNTEDDDDEQRRRFSAALRSIGACPADLAGKVLRISTKKDAPLFGRIEDGTIGALPAFGEMLLEAIRFRADVLILDPLISLHVEDENNNEAMRGVVARLLEAARDNNLAIMVAHHTKKGILTPGNIDDGRGASAVKDLVRIGMTLTVMTEDEAKAFGLPVDKRNTFFRVDDGKMNYAAIQTAEWFERQVHCLDNGDWVAAAIPWSPPVDVVTPVMRDAVAAGLALGTGDGPYSPKLDRSPRSFKALCVSVGITTQPGQKLLLEELLATGGYVARPFKRPRTSVRAIGIQTPDGSPKSANWIDDETDRSGDE